MEIEESSPAPEAAPEAAAEPVVEAPVVEAPAPTEPVADAPEVPALEGPAPAVEEPADPFDEFGGRSEIEAAHRLWQASQTEDGVIQIFLDAGRNLGLGLKEMQALFEELGGQPAEEEIDLDEPLTRGEFLAEQKRQQEAAQAAQAAEAQKSVATTIQATVKELGLDPKDPATKIVLGLGDQHFDASKDGSPEAAARAVRQGYADYQATLEKEAKRYIQDKKVVAETVPSAPAGAGPAAEPEPEEPKSVLEAIKRTRKQLGLTR